MTTHYADESVTLHHGDCLEVLRSLPDASVDSVVTDPPYGLEFMGKDWDAPWKSNGLWNEKPHGEDNQRPTDDRGQSTGLSRWTNPRPTYAAGLPFQQWCELWATECLRVLKPGGHMLAFGGTRTWHRLACAVEDAGFEVRDSIAWLYGCLTADADVLTDRGWVNGLDVQEGDLVAQWDHETGRVELAPVERTFRAPWDGPMRVLRSSDTDQVLTPNHRVYHQTYEREQVAGTRTGSWSGWKVAEAGDLSTWQATRLPIAGTHDGPGIGGEDYAALLGWVWTEGGFDQSGTGVRIYQSSVNPEKCDDIAALLDRMGPHKRYDYARTYTRRNGQAHPYTASTWFFSGELANRVRADLPGKRPTYDLLWRMTADEKRAMLRAAMLGDGSGWGGRSPQFYQKHEDDLVWMQTLLALIDRAGKVTMRPNRPGGQLSLRQRGTTDLQARHLRNSTEHYTGEVWCVKVPSGAFLARRNGRVFITGNSGFPKSLDVSKAIDKAAGAQREEGVPGRYAARRPRAHVEAVSTYQDGVGSASSALVTAPATPDAERWQGWGSAMKPAFEPVVVARKPLIGTVAQNVLTHGTGALNIDGCRVGDGEDRTSGGNQGSAPQPMSWGQATGRERPTGGRWPTNVVLDDTQADELDRQSGVSAAKPERTGRKGGMGDNGTLRGYGTDPDTTGTWPADPGGGASRFFPTFRYEAKAPASERPKVNGTAHPTVKPLDLMRWLVRLVTPPGGTVLEPFAGSGTTVEACIAEGFHCIAIEREADYLPLIMQRINRRLNPVEAIRQAGDDLGLFDLGDIS